MSNSAVFNPDLVIVDGRPVTSSIKIAEVFNKHHENVLKAIRRVKNDETVSEDFGRVNFDQTSYLDSQGRPQPMYQITRDGFTLLAMGFTGKKAMRFKVAYIEAFNRMEAEVFGGKADRLVEVKHSHTRSTQAPGGLDIRYTMDLTKIIKSPSRRTLDLLGRLTGLDFTDLIEDTAGPVTIVEAVIDGFLEECCVADEEVAVPFAPVYACYKSWFADTDRPAYQLSGRRMFGRIITAHGFGRDKRGGTCRILGLSLRSDVAEEVSHG